MRATDPSRHHPAFVIRRTTTFAVLLATLVATGCASEEAVRPPTATGPSRAARAEQELKQQEARVARLRADKQRLEAAQVPEEEGPSAAAGGTDDTTATAGASVFSARDAASFDALAARLSGHEGIAVAPVGLRQKVSTLGSLEDGVAWSTSKAPVAMAAIAAGTADTGDLRQAITASDNAAAERLWSGLGAGRRAADAATAQLRKAGDEQTTVEPRVLRPGYTAFGQTAWKLAAQTRFVAGMACSQAGRQVLGLMGDVVPGQRWGLGATGLRAQMKGGWGPGASPGAGDGWLDRQMGLVTIGGRPLAVALMTDAPDHGTGTANLSALARWTTEHIRPAQIAEPAC